MNLLSLMNQEGSLNIGEASIYALIGFLIVFAGIVIIIVIIWLIGLLMRKTNNLAFLTNLGKKKKKPKAPEQPNSVAPNGEDIPDDIKAAIVAALMAYYSEESPESEFIVKRIRKI